MVPSFLPAVQYPFGPPSDVVVGDFTGDNHPDLLAVGASEGPTLLRGNGDGTFQSPLSLDPGLRFQNVGDFDGDGRLDLVRAVTGSVSVARGNGDGTFQAWVHSPLDGSVSPGLVAVGDMNGDGRPDVVVGPGDGYGGHPFMRVLLGNGDGTFRPELSYRPGQQLGKVVLADLNGDGALDVAGTFYKYTPVFPVAETGYYLSVWLGNGDGTLRAPRDFRVANQSTAPVAGDFDGDGVLDLAVPTPGYSPPFPGLEGTPFGVAYPPTVNVLLGHGDGTFQAPVVSSIAPSSSFTVVAADFNGDALSDLASANFLARTVSVRLGNGDGTF